MIISPYACYQMHLFLIIKLNINDIFNLKLIEKYLMVMEPIYIYIYIYIYRVRECGREFMLSIYMRKVFIFSFSTI